MIGTRKTIKTESIESDPFDYDARNRLTGVDGTSTYLFNANNMRVKKITPESTTLYGWDNDRIFAEYDDKGNAIQETVYFGSTPVALLKDGQTYRIYADQINTPRVLTDNANKVLWAWDSKPFGESQPQEDVDADGNNLSYNLRLPGQYYDIETGQHYNFNRDYNPVTGRYMQSDPIGMNGGMNTFGYVNGNPLNASDLLGLQPTWVPKAGRKIDISIDVHDLEQKNDALGLIKAYKGKIFFTVYIYSHHKSWLHDLKAAGALVGLHLIPTNTATQIDDYFGTYTWKQPVSIHGKASGPVSTSGTKVPTPAISFVRAAGDNGTSGLGNPKLFYTYSSCHTATHMIDDVKNQDHYFFHTLSAKEDKCRIGVDGTLTGLGFTKNQ